MSEENVQSRMIYTLASTELRIPSIHALRAVVAGDRAAIALSCLEYLKRTSRTAEFRDRYSSYREQHKPASESANLDPAAIDAQRDALQAAIGQYEALLKQMSGSTKKELEKAIVVYKAELAKIGHPERSAAMQRWEQDYPASADQTIKALLSQFLEKTAGVDFSATLHKNPEIGKMVFDNPAYESKSAAWKMCYRAGKDATEAARRFVTTWRSEIR